MAPLVEYSYRGVVAYDKLTGIKVGEWEDANAAARDVGVNVSFVLGQARRCSMPKGWLAFRFRGEELVTGGGEFQSHKPRPVVAFDGEDVVAFSNATEAAMALNSSASSIAVHCETGLPLMFHGRPIVMRRLTRPNPRLRNVKRWVGTAEQQLDGGTWRAGPPIGPGCK